MTTGFDKDYLPLPCEHCDSQGYIFIDDIQSSYFVVCKSCGWQTSAVWCQTCGMGGDFVKNIRKKPSYWVCANCKTKYQLPDGFYENPISLFPTEELPSEVRQQIDSEKLAWKSAWIKQQFYAFTIIILGITLLLIPYWLLFKAITYLSLLPPQLKLIGLLIAAILGVLWPFSWKYILKPLKAKIAQWSPINRFENHRRDIQSKT